MANLWPWLAVAGVGALHGLNPANGWAWAAGWGLRSSDRAQALRALLPIAAGHAASVALVAGAVVWGLAMDRFTLQLLAGGLLAACAGLHLSRRSPSVARAPAGKAGLALASFMMASAHGAGLMLVPALVPLCAGDASLMGMDGAGPLALALAAIGVHTAAMLAVTGLVASGVCRGFDAGHRWLGGRRYLTEQPKQTVEGEQGCQHQESGLGGAGAHQCSDHAAGQDGAEDIACFHALDGKAWAQLKSPLWCETYAQKLRRVKAAAKAATRHAAGWR
jgi:hypothetical protein